MSSGQRPGHQGCRIAAPLPGRGGAARAETGDRTGRGRRWRTGSSYAAARPGHRRPRPGRPGVPLRPQPPTVARLPAAATTRTSRRAATSRSSASLSSRRNPGRAIARLRLTMCAPASRHSKIASARSSGVALGSISPALAGSRKIGRTTTVHPGQTAGAPNPGAATRMPATNVAWVWRLTRSRACCSSGCGRHRPWSWHGPRRVPFRNLPAPGKLSMWATYSYPVASDHSQSRHLVGFPAQSRSCGCDESGMSECCRPELTPTLQEWEHRCERKEGGAPMACLCGPCGGRANIRPLPAGRRPQRAAVAR
jgi:hypothetical protein